MFHPWLKSVLSSLLSGTSVTTVEKGEAGDSILHDPANPKDRPISNQFEIGNLFPARFYVVTMPLCRDSPKNRPMRREDLWRPTPIIGWLDK